MARKPRRFHLPHKKKDEPAKPSVVLPEPPVPVSEFPTADPKWLMTPLSLTVTLDNVPTIGVDLFATEIMRNIMEVAGNYTRVELSATVHTADVSIDLQARLANERRIAYEGTYYQITSIQLQADTLSFNTIGDMRTHERLVNQYCQIEAEAVLDRGMGPW